MIVKKWLDWGLVLLVIAAGAFFYKASVLLLAYLVLYAFAFRKRRAFFPPFPPVSLFKNPLFLGLGGLFLYGTLTAFFSLSPFFSFKTEIGLIGVTICLVYLYNSSFFEVFTDQPRIQEKILLLFGVTFLALAMEILMEGKGYFFLDFYFQKIAGGGVDLTHAPRVCHKPAVALMAVALFPMVSLLVSLRCRFVAYALVVVFLYLCHYIYAQTAFFATVGGFLTFLFFQLCPLWGIYLEMAGGVFFILGLPFIKYYLLPTAFWSVYLTENSGLFQRFLIWDFVIDRIFEKPFLGWGLGVSRLIPGASKKALEEMAFIPVHPHNNILQVWLELGGLGALLIASLTGLLLWKLRRFAKQRLCVATYGALFMVVFIMNQTSYSAWHIWWISWVGLVFLLPRLLVSGPFEARPL